MRRLVVLAATALCLLAECAVVLPSRAQGQYHIRFTVPAYDRVGTVCPGDSFVPATEPMNISMQVLQGSTEIWRYRLEDVPPGAQVNVMTPLLPAGAYRLWARPSRSGVSGCDTTIHFTVAALDTAPFEARPFTADHAIFDRRQNRLVHPKDVAADLNRLYQLEH